METERLGTEVTMAGGPGSQQAGPLGTRGQPGLFPLWDCLLPQHLLILWGLLKEPGWLPVSWS